MGQASFRSEMSPSAYQKLTKSEARAYTGVYYSCPPGKTPFLVRAVYRTGNGPGQFQIGNVALCVSEADEVRGEGLHWSLLLLPSRKDAFLGASCLSHGKWARPVSDRKCRPLRIRS